MGESSDRPKSDRQRIIDWYREDVERYKGMIGEETEFGTIVTEKLICSTIMRIHELEEKERRKNDIRRRLREECC